jgi:alpha-1,2-mannosyltransferase
VNICVGKEWYRFPSNFWIPDPRFHVSFIRYHRRTPPPRYYPSGKRARGTHPSCTHVRVYHSRSSFRGELPRPYSPPPDGSKVIHTDFNDQNQEEMSRYVRSLPPTPHHTRYTCLLSLLLSNHASWCRC